MQEIYISQSVGQIIVAGINKDKEFIYFDIERTTNISLVNQISRSRVKEINKTQNIAYVDIGNCMAILNNIAKLKQGDMITLQISRDGFSEKLPATRKTIVIENRHFIVNLSGKGMKYHHSIEKGKKLSKIEDYLFKIINNDNYGLTVKKTAIDLKFDELEKSYQDICSKVLQTQVKINEKQNVAVVVKAPCLLSKVLYKINSGGNIIVDSLDIYNSLKNLAKGLFDVNISYFSKKNIFDYAGITEELEQIYSRKISLVGGGSIIIDNAEAMTVIDVNMGNIDSMTHGDAGIFNFNKKASKIIARQIILRNISGTIVVDFVNLKNRCMQKQLDKVLDADLRYYDSDVNCDVIGMTKSGLLEITKKRTRPSVMDLLFKPLEDRCFSNETVGLDMLQKILNLSGVGIPTVYSQKDVIFNLEKGNLEKLRKDIERIIGKKIQFKISDSNRVDMV